MNVLVANAKFTHNAGVSSYHVTKYFSIPTCITFLPQDPDDFYIYGNTIKNFLSAYYTRKMKNTKKILNCLLIY